MGTIQATKSIHAPGCQIVAHHYASFGPSANSTTGGHTREAADYRAVANQLGA